MCVSLLTPPSVLGARAAALTHLFTQQLPAGASRRRPALCWVLGARREPRSGSAQEGFLEEEAPQQRPGQEFTRQGLRPGDAADRALGAETGGGERAVLCIWEEPEGAPGSPGLWEGLG